MALMMRTAIVNTVVPKVAARKATRAARAAVVTRADADDNASDDNAQEAQEWIDAWKKSTAGVSEGNPALADLWPEFGLYPGGPGSSTVSPLGNEEILSMEKAAETEIIHGRWAMLAVTGAVAQENGTGIPWYATGALCTPDSCLEGYSFPGAISPLAPEGSGAPNFYLVVGLEVVLVGLAEGYRTGIFSVPNGFPEPNVHPGGRFDPLGLADVDDDQLAKLKIAELKHCRLAMGAWLGCINQAIYFNGEEGPVGNVIRHVKDPIHTYFGHTEGLGSGFSY